MASKFECSSVDELRSALLSAKAGDTVQLKAGCFQHPETLKITRPIHLIGEGRREDETKLDLKLEVDMKNGKQGNLLLENFRLCQGLTVKDTTNSSIVLRKLYVTLPQGTRSDCLEITEAKKILLDNCDIYGGSDGLFINRCSDCHIKDCEIRFAQSRGIFANHNFDIEGTEVSNCGGYGIKCRGGFNDIGQSRNNPNDIQAGPWDEMGAGGGIGGFFGGGASPYGGMGDNFNAGFDFDGEPMEGAFPVGSLVRVEGLNSRPELNGKTGIVMSHVESTGRIAVKLTGSSKQFSLKPQNLEYDE